MGAFSPIPGCKASYPTELLNVSCKWQVRGSSEILVGLGLWTLSCGSATIALSWRREDIHIMLVLSHADLMGLLSPVQIIAAVESTLLALAERRAFMPQRMHMKWGANTLLCMPAVGEESVAVKLISVVPGNAARALPVTNGIMVLSDSETGLPQAVLNAAALTAQRTGAVGALGVKYATPTALSSVGIVGCGVQGAWQAIFACSVRSIREVFCVARSATSLEKFIATVTAHAPHVRIVPCTDTRSMLERTQLIIAATTSSDPVLPDEPELLEHKHFISIGSYKPTMQELPDAVYRLAGSLVVDSEHACEEVGDVINPLRRGLLSRADVFSIGDCVTGTRSIDVSRTTVYKSVGAAIYDAYVARAFYQAACSRNLGREVAI